MKQHREVGPSLGRAAPAAILGLCATLVLLATACVSRPSASPSGGASRASAQPLPVGGWQGDRLHCAEGRCERWYELSLDEGAILNVDLYAPVGEGLPDCELLLQDADGNPLPARTGRIQSRRRLRYDARPAVYYLRVLSKGVSDGMLDYELHVHLTPEHHPRAAPVATREREPAPARRPPPDIPLADLPPKAAPQGVSEAEEEPGPEPPPGMPQAGEASPPLEAEQPQEEAPAEPPGHWVVAEVLDVEEVSGRPSAVMIEAGEPEGVQAGMEGVLVDDDVEIGRIQVVEVYPTGSRARILGSLSAPVSFDTLSRIRVPPDGE